jgi:SWI/SNF-related matrix-associated actin-dependent regulator 1 of chromatin subfamily A
MVQRVQIMTDAELDNLCKQFKSTRRHILPREAFFDSGKVTVLKRLIDEAKAQGKRLLVFSMFTQVLDIIKRILNEWEIKWVKLTGDTKVDERQTLVDEFTNDESITVFLLSTLAGGMGINLTAASVVVMSVPSNETATLIED